MQAIAGVNLSITLRSLVTLVGGLVMLAVTSPRLTAMIVVLIPLVLGPLIFYGRRVRALSRDTQDRVADSSGIAGETLNAIQTVQAFTLESLQDARLPFLWPVTRAVMVPVRQSIPATLPDISRHPGCRRSPYGWTMVNMSSWDKLAISGR